MTQVMPTTLQAANWDVPSLHGVVKPYISSIVIFHIV
jgi:hypothetical protein